MILLFGVAVAAACAWILYKNAETEFSKTLSVLQILWLIPVIATYGQLSASIWPSAGNIKLVPLILMGLAAVSAIKGNGTASRCSCTIAWFAGIMLAVLLAAGSKQININDLVPNPGPISAEIMLMLLLPVTTVSISNHEKKTAIAPFLVCAFVTVFSVITTGTLSSRLAMAEQWPFYESAKGYKLFDVAQRFEALVSVASSICYFMLFSLLFRIVGNQTKKSEKVQKRQELFCRWGYQ